MRIPTCASEGLAGDRCPITVSVNHESQSLVSKPTACNEPSPGGCRSNGGTANPSLCKTQTQKFIPSGRSICRLHGDVPCRYICFFLRSSSWIAFAFILSQRRKQIIPQKD